MPFVRNGQTDTVTIPAGQSIALGALYDSAVTMTLPAGVPNGPLVVLQDAQQVYGPYVSQIVVSVGCTSGIAEYVVGAAPALTQVPGLSGATTIAGVTGLQAALDSKQATLVSATNIKTINGTTLLGSGDLVVSGGGSTDLTAAQQAVFSTLGLTLPDSFGPLGTAIVVPYTETSPVSFVQALDLATALAVSIPVQFEIDGIIPDAAIAPGYEQFLYGDLLNLSIIGKATNNLSSLAFNSVVSCASVGGGRYDLVLQAASALPASVKVGGMVLFETTDAATLPNTTWRGVAGSYRVTAVDTGTNRVTLDFANDVALTVGAFASLGVGNASRYCGNVLPNVLFRVLGSIRQMADFGINGGSILTQTGSNVRADGFLAVLPPGGVIAFDLGGAFGGYVNSLKLYAGTRLANGVSAPFTVLENPGSTSLVNLSGVFANNFEVGMNPHDGAQIIASLSSALTNMTTAGVTAYSYSNAYFSLLRLHNMPSGIEVFAGGKVYVGAGVTNTSVTTLYGGDTGVMLADGSGIFDVNFPPPSGGVTDGDKGDIVVSASGATWLFDSAVVTAAAKTVLDDTTVANMVNTLGGATSTGTGGIARAASPAFTGTPTAPTAAVLTNTTQVATTAFVRGEIANISGTITTAKTSFVNADKALALDSASSDAPVTITGAVIRTVPVGTALGTTGSVALDFATLVGTRQRITLTGNITFTTSNLADGRGLELRITGGGSSYTLTWPAFKAFGAALPTSLAAGDVLIVSLFANSTTDASVDATAVLDV